MGNHVSPNYSVNKCGLKLILVPISSWMKWTNEFRTTKKGGVLQRIPVMVFYIMQVKRKSKLNLPLKNYFNGLKRDGNKRTNHMAAPKVKRILQGVSTDFDVF